MLNIPESVKTLYKADGIRKNFRCHFPNGELPDITNADIVQESVQFQESVCSQDVFKFGTSEASVIEFETVGVANMYGMKIECSSEIDCSSLTAAQIAEIEAGTWDGEYVSLADSDIGFSFFRVPYGVFTVDSCPRDHQTMTHRRVTGYSASDAFKISPFERAKLAAYIPDIPSYSESVDNLVYANIGYTNPSMLEEYGTKSVVHRFSIPGEHYYPSPIPRTVIDRRTGETHSVRLLIYTDNYSLYSNRRTLYSYSADGYSESQFISLMETLDRRYDTRGNSTFESLYKNSISSDIGMYAVSYPSSAGVWRQMDKDIPCFSPNRGNTVMSFRIVCGVDWELDGVLQSRYRAYRFPTIYSYSKASNDLTLRIQIENTGSSFYDGVHTKYTFSNAYSLKDLLPSFLEVNASFGLQKRLGSMLFTHISNENPHVIPASIYSQMWFDEYNVEPIGTVRYAYTDESGEEQIVDYTFGDGASVYDMTDNYVLKNMDGASPEIIESILDTMFIPYLAPINFTPVDLSMKGLPYIEAGDALSVTAQDGTVCSTYALRRELDGVQVLTDQIDSESGLIIDSEEAE